MNLLDTASLVVTPNGYKASKLYSIVPTSGTGDMTFTRAGDTATRVNPSGLIAGVNANIPRLDYLGSTCPKILLEPQRTNTLTYSNQFDDVSWSKSRVTVLSNQITSPDGTINADKLTNNNTSTDDYIEKGNLPITAGTYTASIFVKNSDATTSTIRIVHLSEGSVTSQMTYTWATNTFSLTGTNGVSGKVTSYGNGWIRLEFTYSLSITTGVAFRFYGQSFIQSSKFVHIYGAQVEAASFATSYIPTTTASVTRNGDECVKSSISSILTSTEGTLFVDFIYISPTAGRITIDDGSLNNRIWFTVSSSGITLESRVGGTPSVGFGSPALTTIGIQYKIAFAYKNNNFAYYINGNQAGISSSGTVASTFSRLSFDSGIPTLYFNNKVNSLAHWKTRLTNSELATLTTL
jgi:hypothetical protein